MSTGIKVLIAIFIVIAVGVVAVFVYGGNQTISVNIEKISTPTPKPLPEKLKNPPEIMKALYATTWTAATDTQINHLIDLANRTEVNAIVIDVKDYTGYISFDTDLAVVESVGAEKIIIQVIDALINKLHANNIYAIAR